MQTSANHYKVSEWTNQHYKSSLGHLPMDPADVVSSLLLMLDSDIIIHIVDSPRALCLAV